MTDTNKVNLNIDTPIFRGFNLHKFKTIEGYVIKQYPIGFCNCILHRGYISKKQAKKHGCLEKNCRFLNVNPYYKHSANKYKQATLPSMNAELRKKWLKDEISTKEYFELIGKN